MHTAFDDVIDAIARRHYHNHRKEVHSDIVSNGVLRDLLKNCAPLKSDFEKGIIRHWLNVSAPGARGRKLDLLIAEPLPDKNEPDLSSMRFGMENKSVITAHRNKTSRYDDLSETMKAIYRKKPEAIMVGTVLVGVADRVLNIPDYVKRFENDFEQTVRPRLSKGDPKLWDEFHYAISENRAVDPERTVAKFQELPTRHPAHTHREGYDFLMLVPVRIDNVNPPRVERENTLGIDVDADYQKMLEVVCNAYTARWHL